MGRSLVGRSDVGTRASRVSAWGPPGPKTAGFLVRKEVVVIRVYEQLATVAAAVKRLVENTRFRKEVDMRLRRYASPEDPLMIRMRRYAG